ncbi:MAG: ATP-binding protein [Crocinitomicaceae bacterium]|nr:ATP-binding protein [Crocinitomicaceae bacterium]MCF8434925.1 ATP-binding protein [Crocinitomicaceae bacterium]
MYKKTHRDITSLLEIYANSFRSVLIVGPRQSGKTTLARVTFPNKPYVSLENPDERELAFQDPRAFLNRYPNGAILDEVQRAPLLLNYLQELLDNTDEDGLFILTGSNNILLQDHITQTLAGRIGVLDLLPLSYNEIHKQVPTSDIMDLIVHGFYPEVIAKKRNPAMWYASYIRTYVERDVRQIKQIEDGLLFQKFLRLCAGRTGQQLNIAALSNACGINVRTAHSWISILESTYVVRLLQPFHENYNKRIVKSPKLYFCDTGLVCALLNIKTTNELQLSHFRGALVENFIIMEFLKNSLNFQSGENFFYWRDNNGVEIDLIQQNGSVLLPIEIKSAQTFTKDFSSNLKKFMSYSGLNKGLLIYDGPQEFIGSDGVKVANWRSLLTRN